MAKNIPKKGKISWMKVIGVSLTVSIIAGLVGGAITNEYLVAYLFSNLVQKQEEELPIVKKVIEERTFVEESLFDDVVKNVTPSVVTLFASEEYALSMKKQQFEGNESFIHKTSDTFYINRYAPSSLNYGEVSGGTGFVMSTDGIVATCKSLVGSQNTWFVVANDGELYRANVIYTDPYDDLVFLELNKTDDSSTLKTFMFAESDLTIGKKVLAFGTDIFLKPHVKGGLISFAGILEEESSSSTAVQRSKRLFPGEFFHIDFEISASYHCGPVVNLGGELIGMATDFDSVEEGTSYVIPVSAIREAFTRYQELSL